MTHTILIATDNDVRERWVKAFPGCPIYANPAAATGTVQGDSVVWLHVGSDQDLARRLVDECQSRLGATRLVAMSDIPSDSQAIELMERGVVGFCHSYAGPAMLQQVSTVVSNAGLWVGPNLMQRLIRAAGPNVTAETGSRQALDTLSVREREVAQQVGLGSSNKEIARILSITERTVKAHLSAIFTKLGVRDRLHLALFMRSIGAV
jgi:two-component system, NarL family, nitrate/nitrite response regulator NarL